MDDYKVALVEGLKKYNLVAVPKWLKSRSDIHNWLIAETEQYQPKNLMHRVYIILHGAPPVCSQGNPLQFNTYIKGYRAGCIVGNKCKCVAQKRMEGQSRTLQQKYGVSNPYQIPDVKDKIRKINKQKYGVEYPAQSAAIQEKMEKSRKLRTPEQIKASKSKAIETSLQNWGVEHHLKDKEQQEKIKKSNTERWGVEYPLQVEQFRDKMKRTRAIKQQEINSTTKTTVLERYGVSGVSQIQLSDTAKNILFNEENFKQYVANKERRAVCNELDIAPHTLYLYAKKYAATELFAHPLRSNLELKISSWLDNAGIKYISNCRTVLNRRELDFWCEDQRIAIECGGLYWHSENSAGRTRNYHHGKFAECTAAGIQLITIYEDEWKNKNTIVQTILSRTFNIPTSSIGARQCTIVEPSRTTVNEFLDRHHLQGTCQYKVAIGLQYDGKLVSLMTFGKSRFNSANAWELLRYCSSTAVTGGSSKLLTYFEKTHCPTTLISYSDNRWFNGNMYLKLGFHQNKTTIGYQYTDYKNRYNRQQFQKHKLVQAGHSATQTEWEIMQTLKYDRIWDCGQICWVKNFDK